MLSELPPLVDLGFYVSQSSREASLLLSLLQRDFQKGEFSTKVT